MEHPAISAAELLYWAWIGEAMHILSQSLASSQRDDPLLLEQLFASNDQNSFPPLQLLFSDSLLPGS
jgi:hypothetical protein